MICVVCLHPAGRWYWTRCPQLSCLNFYLQVQEKILLPPHLWCFHDETPYYALLNYRTKNLRGNHTSSPSTFDLFFGVFKHCQDIPLRQLLRRGSDSDAERPTAAETVRFEDLKLGRNPLGIEHDQCPLKRFFGTVLFCDIWSVCRNSLWSMFKWRCFNCNVSSLHKVKIR